MNIYDRIINILLEARVEMFIQDRLDEANALDAGHSPDVKAALRQKRLEAETGVNPARSEKLRQGLHKARRGNPQTRVERRATKRLAKDETKMGAHEPLGPRRTADVKGRVKKSTEELRSSPKPQLP